MVAGAVHSVAVAVVALVVIVVVIAVAIVLSHVVHLALKATVAVIVLRTVALLLPVLKDALKAVLNPVVISALTTAVVTASKHETIATAALRAHLAAETTLAAVPVIVSHGALKWWVLATSSPTMRAVMQHPSALALKC